MRILLVYWIMGSCFPQGDFSQIASVPAFFQHFRQHKASGEQALSLWDFWTQHYGDNYAHQHDDDPLSHQHLPLKSLQDFQWIGARWSVAAFAWDDPLVTHLPVFSTGSLPEGIRFSVFRPPLSV